jgi:hypothetical protein
LACWAQSRRLEMALKEAEEGCLQKRLVEVTEVQPGEHSSWHLVAMEVEGPDLSLHLAEVMEVERAVLSWYLVVAMVEAAEVSLQMMELEGPDERNSAAMVEAEALNLAESFRHLH